MNVLIVGGGGREHALAWKAAQSDKVETVFVAPGNAGTADLATNLPSIASDEVEPIVRYAVDNSVGLKSPKGALKNDDCPVRQFTVHGLGKRDVSQL